MFENVVPDEDIFPMEPWGSWASKPGFLPKVAVKHDGQPRHFYGAPPEAYPLCPFCGENMRIWATFDLADPELSLILNAPSQYRRLVLPYCPWCPSALGVNVFRITDAGEKVAVVYQDRKSRPVRNRPLVPAFGDIPIRLERLTKEMMPLTEDAYVKNIEAFGGARAQVGGSPLFPSRPFGLLSPATGKLMQFVASIAEDCDLSSYLGLDPLTGLGISGCLLFFIDWDNGYLGSIYQQ